MDTVSVVRFHPLTPKPSSNWGPRVDPRGVRVHPSNRRRGVKYPNVKFWKSGRVDPLVYGLSGLGRPTLDGGEVFRPTVHCGRRKNPSQKRDTRTRPWFCQSEKVPIITYMVLSLNFNLVYVRIGVLLNLYQSHVTLKFRLNLCKNKIFIEVNKKVYVPIY